MFVKSIDHSSEAGHLLPLNEEDVRTRLNDIACQKMQAICADNRHRLENCKTDPQLLSKGIFYPHEYYAALKATNQTAQIETLKKTNSFYHGFVSSEHFRIDTSLGPMMGNLCGSFILKENVRPSEALKAMVEGPSIILCGVVCQIARLLAVQEVLGTEKFDALFASNSPTPLKLGLNSSMNRLLKFLKIEYDPLCMVEKGDLVQFRNHYLYRNKHAIGIAGAYNMLCIGMERVGFRDIPKFAALGISGKGKTRKEMDKLLIDDFNILPDYALEYLAEETHNAVSKRFNKAAGEVKLSEEFRSELEIISRFDAEKITALANASLEEARRLL